MQPTVRTFPSVWAFASTAQGWLTSAQGELLWDEASRLRDGATLLEIGSFEGRSTMVLGSAVADRGGRVVAVDPFGDDWKFGDPQTRRKFEQHVSEAGLSDVVELIPEYSTKLRPGWTRPLDLLFIDGKHDLWTVRDDLQWVSHVAKDGPVLLHDCFSSIGVTLAVLLHVLPRNELRYERRVGSTAVFTRARPRLADRLRILGEMPWWIRNIGIKILLRLRLRRLTAALGHRSPYDPY